MPKHKRSERENLRQLELLHSGHRLSDQAATKLERILKNEPDDLSCRLKLMGYYFMDSHKSKTAAQRQLQLILWMIKNIPDNAVLRWPGGHVEKVCNPSGYKKCKELWVQQISKYDDNVDVIINAASSLGSDLRLAEKLYRKAIDLEPNNADWSRDLAWLLRLSARKNKSRILRALDAMKEALRKTKKPSEKPYLYDDLAKIAYDVGDWSLARTMAQKSISSVGKFGKGWNNGNAVHDGNCILGRLALREGKLKKALSHLKAASKTQGSPQLDSFGPNMRFAQEMLKAGHREAVIDYLEGCTRFWHGRSKKLQECIYLIRNGRSPKLPRVV